MYLTLKGRAKDRTSKYLQYFNLETFIRS